MNSNVQALLEQLKPMLSNIHTARELFPCGESAGMHLMPISFYSPVPDTKRLKDEIWKKASDLPGIDMRVDEQLGFLREVLPKYRHEYSLFPRTATGNTLQYTYDNNQFVGLDPIVLHCMVREYKPRRIIEVGSGFSTLVSSNALQLNKKGSIICIEPHPRDFIRTGVPGVTQLLRCGVQDIDVDFFGQLETNDILFIDSTHVVKIGSDVQYLFLEVLPRISPGVLIHIHDVFFPHEYPKKWVCGKNFFWNEQYFLQAFLIGNSLFQVKFCNGYMGKLYGEAVREIFPNHGPGMGGGSFWMVRA